jgi:hypothetical protein
MLQINPMSLLSLIQWLKKFPPETKYNYADLGNCLINQYLKAHNINYCCYSDFLDGPKRFEIAGTRPSTFGAALERAEALL